MNKLRLSIIPAVIMGIIGISLVALGTGLFSSKDAEAGDCSKNAIVRCGSTSPSDFRNDYYFNDNKADLKTIYAHFGLTSNEVNRFVSTAKKGTAYKDGRVVVDGRVVATDAWSIGREGCYKGHFNPITYYIGGKKYCKGYNSTAFGSNSLPVMVMFDDNGAMEFAVINDCGNPIGAKVVKPGFSCNTLNMNAVSGKKNTYEFSANVTANNGAKVSKVVYEFGDGSSVTKTNPSEKVTHTYTTPGNYKAKVTVTFALPGGKSKTVSSVKCEKPVKVEEEKQPFYVCKALTFAAISSEQHTYRFTATTSQGNGATLKDANFDFGDGQVANGVTADSDGLIRVDHEYAKPGKYTAKVTVSFNVADGVKSSQCEVKIDVPENPPKECKPGIPIGHPDCEEKPEECLPGVPVGSPKCNPPEELPETGPAEVLGVALGLGSMAAAGRHYYSTRKNVKSAMYKR